MATDEEKMRKGKEMGTRGNTLITESTESTEGRSYSVLFVVSVCSVVKV